MIDELSPATGEQLEEVEPEEYYANVGHDGKGLRVPADLDQSICLYLQLGQRDRAKFNRAIFWLDMASRQWTISTSLSFASLVSAVESLTTQGAKHRVHCKECDSDYSHDVPSAGARFRGFFEEYAPGADLGSRRNKMYSLRSGILHGSRLMAVDQDIAFGWDPPSWNDRQLHDELWRLTAIAVRNWLKNPPAT